MRRPIGRAFSELIETAPTTLAGLQAWASYLGEIMNVEDWMFDEAGSTFIATLVEHSEIWR
jgi:hypothetical protein